MVFSTLRGIKPTEYSIIFRRKKGMQRGSRPKFVLENSTKSSTNISTNFVLDLY